MVGMDKEILLSERLKMNASFVPYGASVADVGCDHGYVAIYLLQQGIAKRVLAMDVNSGPLQRAESNIQKRGLAAKIECRLSNGLERLKAGEVNTILIGGMGGLLMIRILTEGKDVENLVDTLVLQPQSDLEKVRRFLHQTGFSIKAENMVKEDGKFYTAIQAVRGQEKYITAEDYLFGQRLIQDKNPVCYDYLCMEQKNYHRIYERLKENTGEKVAKRVLEVERYLTQIAKAISRF